MAITVEELKVVIDANSTGFTNSLQKINRKLDDLTGVANKTSNSLGKNLFKSIISGNVVGNMLTSTLGKLGSAFTNVTKSVIANGSSYSRLKVATETITRNMGITTQQVNDLRNSLAEANTYGSRAEMVIKSLALSGLVQMSEKLKTTDARTGQLATGVEALTLTMKDLSASAGISSADGIERLTKFVRRGEATFADGIIELGNLNQAYNAYAKELGKTRTELSAQELAQARLNIVMVEGRKAWGAYANTMQTSGKAFLSVKDAMRSSAELLGNYFEPALGALANGMLQFAVSVRNAMVGSESSIRTFANRVAGYVVAIIRVIGRFLSMIPVIGTYFNNLATFSLKPVKVVDSLADAVGGVGSSADSAGNSVDDLKKKLAGLAGFDEMNVLNPQDGGTGGAGGADFGGGSFGGVGGAVDIPDFSTGINKQADSIIAKWSGFYNKWIKPVVDGFIDFGKWIKENKGYVIVFGATITALAIAFGVVTGAISLASVASGIATAVMGGLSVAVGFLGSVVGFLVSPIGLAIIAIGLMVGALVWLWNNSDKVNIALKKGWEAVVRFAKALADNIRAIFSSMGNNIKRTWNNAVIGAKNIYNGIKKAFTNVWNIVKNIFGKIGSFIGNVFKGVVNGYVYMVNRLLGGMANLINGAVKPLNALIRGANDKLNLGISELRVNVPKIPYLAQGGTVTGPTMAVMGEQSRKEVVLPLERNTGWADILADKLNEAGGGEKQLIVKIGEKTIYDGFVDWHNRQALLGNSTVLKI